MNKYKRRIIIMTASHFLKVRSKSWMEEYYEPRLRDILIVIPFTYNIFLKITNVCFLRDDELDLDLFNNPIFFTILNGVNKFNSYNNSKEYFNMWKLFSKMVLKSVKKYPIEYQILYNIDKEVKRIKI